jgi:hypothetical protein
MPNVQVSSFATGGTAYTMTYNPVGFDPAPGYALKEQPILHGASAWQKQSWDGRIRVLEWRRNRVQTNPFATQVTKMRLWKGKIMYFNFQNIVDLVTNWPVSNTWKKARVIDVLEVPADGEIW